MRTRVRYARLTVALALGGGFLMAGPGTGCFSFAAESFLSSTDFCFIFDCQNGILGGTIDPCAPGNELDGEAYFTVPAGPTFVDCPGVSGP